MANRADKPSSNERKTSNNLFGRAPLLYGENVEVYNKMLARICDSLQPKNLIEKIWAHDVLNEAWEKFRLEKMLAAYLSEQIRNRITSEARSRAEADPKLMEGTDQEKQDMKKLLNRDSKLSWSERSRQFPHAYEKFQKACDAAEATLDKELIKANVMIKNIDIIERFKSFIAISQRRYDTIIREFDRHRYMQNQNASVRDIVEGEFKTLEPAAIPASKVA